MRRRQQQQKSQEEQEQAEKDQDRDEDEEDDEEDRFRPFGDDVGNPWVAVQKGWTDYWWDRYEAAYDKLEAAVSDDPTAFKPEVQSFVKNMTIVETALGRMKSMLSDPANQKWIAADPKLRTNYFLLRKRWEDLAAGFYVDTRVVEQADLKAAAAKTPEVGRRAAPRDGTRVDWRHVRFTIIGYRAPLLKPMPSDWGPASPWPPDEWFDPKVGCDCEDFGAGPLPLVPILIVAGVAIVSIAAICWAVTMLPYTVNLLEETRLQEEELKQRVAASEQGRSLQPSTLPGDKPQDSGPGPAAAVLGGIVATLVVGGVIWKMTRS